MSRTLNVENLALDSGFVKCWQDLILTQRIVIPYYLLPNDPL